MGARTRAATVGRVVTAFAVVASLFGLSVASAPQASAAGTWQNPGNWTLYTQTGELALAGRGGPLQPPTRPYECNNGTNDDQSLTDPNLPPVFQDTMPDFNATASESGTATGGTASTLVHSGKTWATNQWAGYTVVITGGTGSGQFRKVVSNTNNTLTVSPNWTTTPNNTSQYQIRASDPECESATDDSEIMPGIQPRVITNLAANIAADGTLSSATFTLAPIYVYINQPLAGTVAISTTATSVSGWIDPATGAAQFDVTMDATVVGPFGTCPISGINVSARTSNPGGVPYNSSTGFLTVVDNTFVVPATTGGGLCGSVNSSFGLPSAPGQSKLLLTARVTPTSGNQQPTAYAPLAPVGVTEGQVVTLMPSATDPDLVLCPSPGPCFSAPPKYNWRWTQTSGPTISQISVNPETGAATFIPPDGGSYSFLIEVGDGAGPTMSPNTATVSFSVSNVPPTVNAGPDLTVSAGLSASANPYKLVGQFTSPAPSDATGRTYLWQKISGGTCGASVVTITNPTALTTTFSTAASGSDCTQFVRFTGTDSDGQSSSSDMMITVKGTTAGTISGRVTGCTPACSVLSGATVNLYQASGMSLTLWGFTTTDANGDYSFNAVPPGNYKVFFSKAGYTSRWLGNGLISAANSPVIPAPYAGADQTLWGGTGRGTLQGTVNKLPSGNVGSGVEVRLYDAATGWFSRKTTTDASGFYQFANINPGNYKLNFAKGSSTYAEIWSGKALNVSTARLETVVSGSTTVSDITVNNNLVPLKSTGTATGGSTTTVVDTGKGWSSGQWNGYRVRMITGAAAGQSRVVNATTATTLTVSTAFGAAVAAGDQYVIEAAATNAAPGTGQATGGGNTGLLGTPPKAYLDDATKSWTTNMWAGYRLRIIAGRGVGQVKEIVANTATRLEVKDDWATASIPNASTVYAIEPVSNASPGYLQGGVGAARTGASVPAGQTEVRVYDHASGTFRGKVLVGQGLAGDNPAVNYSFFRWTADPAFPNVQQGLPPGVYRVLFRVIGTGGGSPAFCSTWNANIRGGPNTGSSLYANPVMITAGQVTIVNAYLAQSAGCTASN
ncbi:carboxypeptidase regulatory-like domain-containing protein [Rhabdothermincola sp.]|uniref:carboxypeptidase regulatory-like domain-containing protein n=1 Tax=Rhabdothermincola sp. TaxID=2820405 RepID=UPI002FDF5151